MKVDLLVLDNQVKPDF